MKNRYIGNFMNMRFAAAIFCILYCMLWVLCDFQGPPFPMQFKSYYSILFFMAAMCVLAVFVLVYFSLWKGVKSSGKVGPV
jgi:hypothetical protein